MNKLQQLLFRAVAVLAIAGLMGIFAAGPASAAVPLTPEGSTASSFVPVADAFVKASSPDSNFGGLPALRARSAPTVRTYLRFTVAGLGGQQVVRARLQLYAKSSSSKGLSAKSVSSNTWGESTITYNNSPAPGSALATTPSVSAGTWITLNVSTYVTGEGTYSFALTTPDSATIGVASRESGARAPRLILTLQSWQPSFPIRAAFYYPWFPEAWKQSGIFPYTNYTPQLSYYSSIDPNILKQHLAMMQYANIQVGIASWWGQGTQTDSKVAGLLNAASGTDFRWALYYENESLGDPSVTQIHSDLVYIRNHYGGNPSFLRVNGKFVVFVYADGNDSCGMARRWKAANTVGAYVVLKVFPGYESCASQPNSWHQYSPAVAADQQGSLSYSLSPGFWLKGQSVRLPRDVASWTQNVKDMVASNAKWQLITTFNEWGEGTAVEPALEWSSTSGYGQYLDVLHSIP